MPSWNRQIYPPKDGLFEVSQESPEYWDVFENMLKKPPNHQHAKIDPKTGQSSDVHGKKNQHDARFSVYQDAYNSKPRSRSCATGMHDAWITKLQRIQNPDLYTYYDSQKQRIGKTPGATDVASGEVKQVRGWHGTGGFPAENIYNDRQDGFMMQFASEGQWGRGLYFAEDAGYSHFYASPADPHQNDLQEDEREMMLASVITGNTVEMDRDNPQMMHRLGGRLNGGEQGSAIKAPPFLNSTPPLHVDGSGAKYNTITGFTQIDLRTPDGQWIKNQRCPRSRVWIVYENGRAYPQYLVRYYRGPFDPTRVKYQSREEAKQAAARLPATLKAPAAPTSTTQIYYHIGPDGSYNQFNTADCALIDNARRR